YSALFLFARPAANEKKPHPAGFVAFIPSRRAFQSHLLRGIYSVRHYDEYLGFSPPQTSDRPFGEEGDYYGSLRTHFSIAIMPIWSICLTTARVSGVRNTPLYACSTTATILQ